MAEIKFSCPHCQQHIQADTGYAGMQLNCPSCNGGFVVPGTPLPAPPPVPAYAPPPSPPAQQTGSRGGCPSCGVALPRGAVLCTSCGYNLATGQRTVAGRPVAPGKGAADPWATPWYKSAFPYIGAVVLILGILYFLGRENPTMKLAFVGFAALYALAVHIIVVVSAFRESVGTGFLTMCVPFYAIYYVFRVSENDTLKLLYGTAVVLQIILKFIEP